MINIPEEVKKLLQKDSVEKNFRVHFPNGERADITNENIVSESLSFTESLCSQSELKFGLCESPSIEFETYGVGKIKGATIECSIEIPYSNEVTSATTQYSDNRIIYYGLEIPDGAMFSIHFTEGIARALNRVEIHTSDGSGEHILELNEDKSVASIEWKEAYNTENPYGDSNSITVYFSSSFETDNQSYYYTYVTETMYSIPLGTFVVDSCKKQADMTHRKIIAYIADANIKPYSDSDNLRQLRTTRYKQAHLYDPYKRVLTYLDDINLNSFEKTEIGLSYQGLRKVIGTYASGEETGEVSLNIKGYHTQSISATDKSLYVTNNMPIKYFIEQYKYRYTEDRLYELLVDEMLNLIGIYDIDIVNNLRKTVATWFGGMVISYKSYNGSSFVTNEYTAKGSQVSIYPYLKLNSSENTSNYVIEKMFIPYSFRIGTTLNGSGTEYVIRDVNDIALYKLGDSLFDTVEVSEGVNKNGSKYVWVNNWNLDKVRSNLASCIELQGKFGKTNRDGSFELFSLKNKFNALYPSETLYPADDLYPRDNVGLDVRRNSYESIWYDDDETLPFGSVSCTYNNGTGSVYLKVYADGYDANVDLNTYQNYDISDNEIIKANTYTSTQITSILNAIASNISGIRYMPAEVTMIGRPDLEVGDILSIKTSDGWIETIVLQRTMEGIQRLTDNIIST